MELHQQGVVDSIKHPSDWDSQEKVPVMHHDLGGEHSAFLELSWAH